MILYSHIKIGWRNLRREGIYSFINIGGLALSIAACLLIGLYIYHELHYDRDYPAAKQLYRLIGVNQNQSQISKGTAFPAPMQQALSNDFPDVEQVGRLLPNTLFGAGSNSFQAAGSTTAFYEDGFTFMDPELLEMLELPMVYGNRQRALGSPYSLVLTRSKAEKYFPGRDPVGEKVFLANNHELPWVIGGVVEDLPGTSHLKGYEFFLSLKDREAYPGEQENWGASNYVYYLKLKEGTSVSRLEKVLRDDILNNYVIPSLKAEGVQNVEKVVEKDRLELQSIQDIHLQSYDIDDYKQIARGDIRTVRLFIGIACFILAIACVNFINLTTARSVRRNKEIGVKKVVGCLREQLIAQFLTESVLFSVIAFFAATLMAFPLVPLFNHLAGTDLSFPLSSFGFWIAMLFAALLIGLVAGLYPALFLSSFRPVKNLNNQLDQGAFKARLLRSGLVVFQFTCTILLISGTLVISRQMHYILNKKLGYDKDMVVMIQGMESGTNRLPLLKQELKEKAFVTDASISSFIPVRMSGAKRNGNPFRRQGDAVENSTPGQFWEIDEDYLSTMGMQLSEGRNFSPEIASDSSALIVNQRFVEALGLKQPVGEVVDNGRLWHIIGVVEDFNFESLRSETTPLCLSLSDNPGMLLVKMSGTDLSASLNSIKNTAKQVLPDQELRYSFLDERFEQMYADVRQSQLLTSSFAGIAVFVACLGLFGLAAFTIEQRVKEVGVRKVLGATVKQITLLLSKDFILLVILAILIACPLSWWAMSGWLDNFAYRVELDAWLYVLSGAAAILISMLTVSFQSIKAALMKPVDSLRNE